MAAYEHVGGSVNVDVVDWGDGEGCGSVVVVPWVDAADGGAADGGAGD